MSGRGFLIKYVIELKEGVDMRKILIVIDMQNDFIDAALGTKEAVAIVDAVKEKIMSYPAADVIATMDTHGENYMETQEGQNLPVMHCIKGTDGWQIRPDIAELLKEATIYEKPTFGSVKLAEESESSCSERGNRAGTHRTLHGYLCCVECTAFESCYAGGQDFSRFFLLCRRDTGKASGCAGDYEIMSDLCEIRPLIGLKMCF